jgi:hypothetical protein
MMARAITAGMPFARVVGDAVYGSDRRLRRFLEKHERPFVLTIRRTETLWSVLAGRLGQQTAADLAAALPDARIADLITKRNCSTRQHTGGHHHIIRTADADRAGGLTQSKDSIRAGSV